MTVDRGPWTVGDLDLALLRQSAAAVTHVAGLLKGRPSEARRLTAVAAELEDLAEILTTEAPTGVGPVALAAARAALHRPAALGVSS